jgi:hypothetical protein
MKTIPPTIQNACSALLRMLDLETVPETVPDTVPAGNSLLAGGALQTIRDRGACDPTATCAGELRREHLGGVGGTGDYG